MITSYPLTARVNDAPIVEPVDHSENVDTPIGVSTMVDLSVSLNIGEGKSTLPPLHASVFKASGVVNKDQGKWISQIV